MPGIRPARGSELHVRKRIQVIRDVLPVQFVDAVAGRALGLARANTRRYIDSPCVIRRRTPKLTPSYWLLPSLMSIVKFAGLDPRSRELPRTGRPDARVALVERDTPAEIAPVGCGRSPRPRRWPSRAGATSPLNTDPSTADGSAVMRCASSAAAAVISFWLWIVLSRSLTWKNVPSAFGCPAALVTWKTVPAPMPVALTPANRMLAFV